MFAVALPRGLGHRNTFGEKMNFTLDDLAKLRRIVASAGLLKAFDGVQQIDLRLVVDNLISDAENMHGKIQALEDALYESNMRLKRITDPDTYHD